VKPVSEASNRTTDVVDSERYTILVGTPSTDYT